MHKIPPSRYFFIFQEKKIIIKTKSSYFFHHCFMVQLEMSCAKSITFQQFTMTYNVKNSEKKVKNGTILPVCKYFESLS